MPLRPTARRAALRIAPRLALAVSIAAVTSFASMVMPVQAHVRILDRDTDRGGDSDRRDDRDRDDRDRDDRRDDRDRRIIKIKPAIGRPGDLVTITGDDIGEFHVRITLGGISANIVSVAENRVTFVVPAGVPAGAETVVVTTPRGRHGSITFQVLEGVLLTGKAKAPASSALVNIPPVPVDGTQIENGVIMTRLSVRLTPDSTVAQVNAALISVNGGIVTMAPGTLSIAVGIPRPSTLANLESLVATLNRQPGIRLASLALEVSSKLFLSPLDFVAARSLFPSRFPAAWNALALVVATDAHGSVVCTRPKVPVLIADFFGSVPPGFSGQVPFFQSAAPARRILSADDAGHGYLVALAGVSRVGANPFGECLDVRLIQSAGFFPDQDIVSIQSHMPAAPTKFIVNYSMGFADSCGGSASGQPCQPPSDRMPGATTRAFHATTWKEMTAARWPDFLMVVAAGNEGLEESTTIYPAMGDARFGSPMAIAAFHDPTLGFVDDVHLWDPPPAFAANGFLSLAGDAAQVASDLHARGLDTPASVAPNVVVVGSANNMLASNAVSKRVTPEQLVQSGFSDRNSDVLAVGEEPFGVSGLKGTSFSAPQVTGLACAAARHHPPSDSAECAQRSD
jgi:phage baseplate assembly protein gpV